jgi:hypothetical protein
MRTVAETPSRRFVNFLSSSPLRWLLLCAFLGGLISALPNLISAWQSGSPVWIADNDEFTIASLSSQSYLHHIWRFSDPTLPPGQGHASYPWIVFAPGILTAKILRIGPGPIMFLLRIWAGLSLGAVWFLLIHEFVRKQWLAASLAIFFLFDAGVLAIRPVIRPLQISFALLSGNGQELFAANPQLHPEWRVMTPALNLGIALIYLFLLQRARRNPSRGAIFAAGAALGLLVWSFFYFWTACFLALAISFLLDSGHRALYAKVGVLGLLIGSPALVSSYFLKHSTPPDWLLRIDLFIPVPRFGPLGFSRLPALFIIAGFFIVWRCRRDLINLWAVSVSALTLQYSEFFTGIHLEGFHWQYLWAYTLALLVLLTLLRFVEHKDRWVQYPIFFLIILEVATGISVRAAEAVRTRQSTEFTAAYRGVREQLAMNAPLREDAVIGGDHAFLDSAQILGPYRPLSDYVTQFSPSTSDHDLDERRALNAFLLGVPKNVFLDQQRFYFSIAQGRERRDLALREVRLKSLGETFDRVASDPASPIRKYEVRYLAVRRTSPLTPNIGPDWKTVQTGEWQIRERSNP